MLAIWINNAYVFNIKSVLEMQLTEKGTEIVS